MRTGAVQLPMGYALTAAQPLWPLWLAGDRSGSCRRAGVRMVVSSPDAGSLNALLTAVGAARDRAAFEALFRHFAPRVKAYLLRLGAGNPAADAQVRTSATSQPSFGPSSSTYSMPPRNTAMAIRCE